MKANYKVVNNRQAQLKKVIQDFEPTGACAFLMFRYYVMQMMAESEAAGGLGNCSVIPLNYESVIMSMGSSTTQEKKPFRTMLTLMTNPRMSPSTSMAPWKSSPKNSSRAFSWLWPATLSMPSSIFRT